MRAPGGVRELHMIVLEALGELDEITDWSKRLHEHEMLCLSAFLKLPEGDKCPGSGSKSVPGDAPGSLACVSNL